MCKQLLAASAFTLWLLPLAGGAQQSASRPVVEGSAEAGSEAPLRLLDRIVAVVDEDPILLSDIELALRLDRFGPVPEGRDPKRWALERLIEERLRQHEVDRHDLGPLEAERIETQLAEMRERFPDPEAMAEELRRHGLDEAGLRHQISRQLRVLRYVKERLGPRIFVDLDDIEAYYADELPPLLAAQGIPLPPIEEVREQIRALIRERRLGEEIERWTEELRAAADIEELYDSPAEELPPLVRRIEKRGKEGR